MNSAAFPVLHHYPGSPFSEKVRLVLGLKDLDWRSVTVPVVLPKPDVAALAGGYRRTPIMQVGADVYCDTALICRVLDRLAPEPPLWPAAQAGLASMLAQWADGPLFWAAVPYAAMHPEGPAHLFPGAPPEALQAFRADRAAMTRGRVRPPVHDCRAQLRAYLGWLDSLLGDGRAFLCGDAPCVADFATVQSVWYLRRAPPVAGPLLLPHPRIGAWADRVLACGHGRPQPMSSAEAIALAAAADLSGDADLPIDAAEGFARGERVVVSATDYATDAIEGELAGLDGDSMTLLRTDPRAGRVRVHFPRIGFQLLRAEAAAR